MDAPLPETPTLSLDEASDTGSSDGDGVTNDATPTYEGAAEPGATIEIFDGATSLGATIASEEGDWSFTVPAALSEGDHDITATAANASSVSEPSEILTITIDTQSPEVKITEGPSGLTDQDFATLAFSSEEGATFACDLDGDGFEACVSPREYMELDEGGHIFTVRAADIDGNTGTASRTWTVDTTPPDAPAITAPANDSISASGSVTVSGTAEPGSTVEVFDGAASRGTTAANASTGAWSKTINEVSNGSHTYTAKATDAAGNTSDASNARTVRVDTIAPKGTVKINNGAASTNKAAVTLNLSATDNAGGTGVKQMRIRNVGGAWSAWMPYTTTKPWKLKGGKGTKTVNVEFRDGTGNVSPRAADSIKRKG